MSISEKLSCLKHRDRLTTEEIALRAGLPLSTLNKIFSGQTKNPALNTMDRICRVFNVPIRYVLDDSVSEDCNVTAYAEQSGMLLLSPPERELLFAYRRLPGRDRRCVENLLHQYILRRPEPTDKERLLPCYEPVAEGARGLFTDAWRIDTLRVPVDRVTQEADFAITVLNDDLFPVYVAGDILAVRQWECENLRLGVFLLNGEGYIRTLQRRRGEVRLIPINRSGRVIQVRPLDELRTLGIVLGAVRDHRPLQT